MNEWNDVELMSQAIGKNLKRKFPLLELISIRFLLSETSIIELMIHLKRLYLADYEFSDLELCVWRKMMKA